MSTNLTFQEAKRVLAKYVGEGSCQDQPIVAEKINQVQELLLNEGDWKNTLRPIRFCTWENCIALPREAEVALKVDACGAPGNVWTGAYEFLDGGPGALDFSQNDFGKDLVDQGWHPTFFPFSDRKQKLIFFSDSSEDLGKTIFVRGYGEYNNEIVRGTVPGEEVPINYWDGGIEGNINLQKLSDTNYSQKEFLDITYIKKPLTTGFITLALFDRTTCEIAFLGKYHPMETEPKYRRYRITSTSLECYETITVWCKVAHQKLVHDTDLMLIQNVTALMTGLRALRELENGDMSQYNAKKQEAKNLLNAELSNVHRPANEFDVQVEGYGIGDSLEMY